MKKEEIDNIAQMLTKMKDATLRLENAKKDADLLAFKQIKKELIELNAQIGRLI